VEVLKDEVLKVGGVFQNRGYLLDPFCLFNYKSKKPEKERLMEKSATIVFATKNICSILTINIL